MSQSSDCRPRLVVAAGFAPKWLRNLARGGTKLLFGRAIFVGSSFLLSALLARGMSKADVGTQVFLQGLGIVLGMIACVETGQAAAQRIGFARSKDPGSVPITITAAATVAICGGGIVGICAMIAFLTGLAPGGAPRLALGLTILAYVFSFAVRGVGSKCFIALGRFRTAAALDGASGTLLALLGVGAIFLYQGRLSPQDVFMVTAGAFLSEACLSLVLMRAQSGAARTTSTAPETLKLLRIGFPLMLANAATQASLQIPVWLLVGTHQANDAAVLNLSTRVATLIGIIIMVLNQAATPTLSAAIADDDVSGLRRALNNNSALSFGLAAAAGVPMMIFPHELLSIFFGGGYRAGAAPLIILLVGQLVEAGAGPSQLALVLSGRQRLAFAIVLSSCVLVAPLMLMTLKMGELVAGALALAIPMMLRAALCSIAARTLVAGRPRAKSAHL